MHFQRALEIITLALALSGQLSALGAFQGIILPGIHLPHLGRVWQMEITILPKDVSVVAGF